MRAMPDRVCRRSVPSDHNALRCVCHPALRPDLALTASPQTAGGVIYMQFASAAFPPGGGASRIPRGAFVRDRLQPSIATNRSEGRLCSEIRQQCPFAA
jgi:hypothetical protein